MFSHIQNSKIILDTGILIDLTKETHRLPLLTFLVDLQKGSNAYYHSDYSIFEILRGRPKIMQKTFHERFSFLSSIEVKRNILLKASDLINGYKHHGIIQSCGVGKSGISDGDLIIAATSFLYLDSCILTKNAKDFPMPFFEPLLKHHIEYKDKKDKVAYEVYYILKPDIEFEKKIYNIRD